MFRDQCFVEVLLVVLSVVLDGRDIGVPSFVACFVAEVFRHPNKIVASEVPHVLMRHLVVLGRV